MPFSINIDTNFTPTSSRKLPRFNQFTTSLLYTTARAYANYLHLYQISPCEKYHFFLKIFLFYLHICKKCRTFAAGIKKTLINILKYYTL